MSTSPPARLLIGCIALLTASCATAPPANLEADVIRDTERARITSLVTGDLATAATLHADEFQLVNPLGGVLSKAEYLGAIETGQLDYVVWNPADIAVKQQGGQAVIRYRSDLQVTFRGTTIPKTSHWHTDLYEKRGGRWQVVWSQAT
jgi:hypothetical protein